MQPWVQCQSASWTTTLMLRDRSAKSGAEWVSHYLLVVSACMASFLYTPFFMLFLTQSVLCLSCQESLKKQLIKRVQNVSTKKQQGATPSRKKARRLSFQSGQETSTDETDDSTSSTASTVILERSPLCSSPEIEQSYGKCTNLNSGYCFQY